MSDRWWFPKWIWLWYFWCGLSIAAWAAVDPNLFSLAVTLVVYILIPYLLWQGIGWLVGKVSREQEQNGS